MSKPFESDFQFTLPRGFVDDAGVVHRDGTMRLATALDEIESVQDPRVQANDAFVPVLLLSRVITRLGTLPNISAEVIGSLFVSDLSYLEDLYQRINHTETITMGVICPQCNHKLHVQVAPLEA